MRLMKSNWVAGMGYQAAQKRMAGIRMVMAREMGDLIRDWVGESTMVAVA